jgi:hypothetical protein
VHERHEIQWKGESLRKEFGKEAKRRKLTQVPASGAHWTMASVVGVHTFIIG